MKASGEWTIKRPANFPFVKFHIQTTSKTFLRPTNPFQNAWIYPDKIIDIFWASSLCPSYALDLVSLDHPSGFFCQGFDIEIINEIVIVRADASTIGMKN